METLKFLCISLLAVLLLKNLGVIAWDNGPVTRLEETRTNLVDAIQGEPNDPSAE